MTVKRISVHRNRLMAETAEIVTDLAPIAAFGFSSGDLFAACWAFDELFEGKIGSLQQMGVLFGVHGDLHQRPTRWALIGLL